MDGIINLPVPPCHYFLAAEYFLTPLYYPVLVFLTTLHVMIICNLFSNTSAVSTSGKVGFLIVGIQDIPLDLRELRYFGLVPDLGHLRLNLLLFSPNICNNNELLLVHFLTHHFFFLLSSSVFTEH